MDIRTLDWYRTEKPVTKIPSWNGGDEYRYHWLDDNNPELYELPLNWEEGLEQFAPNIAQLCWINESIMQDEIGTFAGKIRQNMAVVGDVRFAFPHNILNALRAGLKKNPSNPAEILSWTENAIMCIHPFYNGNRRTLWAFANLWLLKLGFQPMKWKEYESEWRWHIGKTGNERAQYLVEYYCRTARKQ